MSSLSKISKIPQVFENFDAYSIYAFLVTFGSFAWPLLACYSATLATTKIPGIGLDAYSCDWYDLPLELRKTLILIMTRTQTSIHFTGFNMIYCNLQTFTTVKYKFVALKHGN